MDIWKCLFTADCSVLQVNLCDYFILTVWKFSTEFVPFNTIIFALHQQTTLQAKTIWAALTSMLLSTILLCIVNIYNIVGTSLNDVVLCTITLFYFSIISVFWHPFCGFVNAANTKLKWCVRIYYTHIHKRKMITLCCNVCNKFIVTIKSLVASQYCACATWMYMWCCGSLIICDFKFYSTHNTGMNNALSWIMFKFTHNSASRSN